MTASLPDLSWWRESWAENDRCLYGDRPAEPGDAQPVRLAFTTQRSNTRKTRRPG